MFARSGTKGVGFYIYYNGDTGQRSAYCTASLTVTKQTYSCSYTTNANLGWGFGFDLGADAQTSDLFIDNVSILEQ